LGTIVETTTATSGLPPGPSSPRIVQLAGRFLRPNTFLQRCSKRYGPIFTLRMPMGENVVSVSDPEAIKAIFTSDPETFQVGTGGNALLEPLVGSSSLLTLDGAPHMRQRRLLLPPFHGERMQRYGEVIREVTESSLADWPLREPFPLQPRMQAITLDVILRAVFGIKDAERQDELRRTLRVLLDFGQSRLAFLPWIRHWARGSWVRFLHMREGVDALLYEEITRRRQDGDAAERDDIMSLLVSARYEDGSPMTDKELRDELITLLVAGHETTATALAWAFELLFRHESPRRKLIEEIRTGNAGEEYLEAVISETLRLRPVIEQVSRRVAAPVELNGYTIPAGTLLAPSIYLVHRRPDIYPDPGTFKPERFLENPPQTYAWLPFGGGVRRCIGASFATLEMKVVLKTILSRAELRPADAQPEPPSARAVTTAPKHGAMAVLEQVHEPTAATATPA
jgi:cytochrome P450 family 135